MKTTAVKPMKCEFATEGLLWIDKIATGVGLIIFNSEHKFAAGIHLLRGKSRGDFPENPAYYADTAIDHIYETFKSKGINTNLSVAIAGGANLLSTEEQLSVGQRLISTVKALLSSKNLTVKLEAVGGNKLRTMILNIDEGKIQIS